MTKKNPRWVERLGDVALGLIIGMLLGAILTHQAQPIECQDVPAAEVTK